MYNPYAKGRWYRIFIESNGTTPTIVEDDLGCDHSANYLQTPEDFHIIDTKYDINSVAGEAVTNMDIVMRLYSDKSQAVALPPVAHYDWCYIYIFGYFH